VVWDDMILWVLDFSQSSRMTFRYRTFFDGGTFNYGITLSIGAATIDDEEKRILTAGETNSGQGRLVNEIARPWAHKRESTSTTPVAT
jgi:hypothetical protein